MGGDIGSAGGGDIDGALPTLTAMNDIVRRQDQFHSSVVPYYISRRKQSKCDT
jgi:hypothetical protein